MLNFSLNLCFVFSWTQIQVKSRKTTPRRGGTKIEPLREAKRWDRSVKIPVIKVLFHTVSCTLVQTNIELLFLGGERGLELFTKHRTWKANWATKMCEKRISTIINCIIPLASTKCCFPRRWLSEESNPQPRWYNSGAILFVLFCIMWLYLRYYHGVNAPWSSCYLRRNKELQSPLPHNHYYHSTQGWAG